MLDVCLGPIIRVAPDEIHINDVGFLDTVYTPSTSYRDKYEYQLRNLQVPGGIGTKASHNVHRKRRDALSSFFGKQNVLYLEPLIAVKAEQLCQLVRKRVLQRVLV